MKERTKILHQLIHTIITEFKLDNDDLINPDCIEFLRSMCYQDLHNTYKANEKFEFEKEFQETIKHNLSVTPPNYNDNNIELLTEHIMYLKSLPQPEQRTPEWYAFRKDRVTASDLASAVGIRGQGSRKILIEKKCGISKPFTPGPAIRHGVKFEDIAVMIYEMRNNVKIDEYGCVPHPTLSIFGASPDGICSPKSGNSNYIGRMLEIKCPYSRIITNIIPEYYYYQVQGQLEVCELEYCDFLECEIKEYPTGDAYWSDINDSNNPNYGLNSEGMEKGILIEYFDKEKEKTRFHYAPYGITQQEFDIWEDKHFDQFDTDDNLKFGKITYWKLIKYNVKLVKRDRLFWAFCVPQIKEFWDKVVECRKNGVESLKKPIEKSSRNNSKANKKGYREINLFNSNKYKNKSKPQRVYKFISKQEAKPEPQSKP